MLIESMTLSTLASIVLAFFIERISPSFLAFSVKLLRMSCHDRLAVAISKKPLLELFFPWSKPFYNDALNKNDFEVYNCFVFKLHGTYQRASCTAQQQRQYKYRKFCISNSRNLVLYKQRRGKRSMFNNIGMCQLQIHINSMIFLQIEKQ